MPANFINTSGNIIANSGNFTTLIVNGSGVSMGGHTHSSSDITNFNSSVSGLVSGIYAPLSGKLDQFANTSSSELSSIISDETGTGLLVFNSSPTLTGVPLVPTATSGTNTNQIASTAFVRTEVSNLVASAPSTLDTLNELASALGNDSNFSTTITNNLAGKANLSGATFTGSISSPSGNFTESLLVNGTTVSVSGHTHTSSDITNFNSSVSGLLPTIANSANNRILTSTGSSVGINAESNLTFDGTYLVINAFESETSSISFRDYEEGLERLTIRYDDDVDICEIYSATELSILGPASNNIYFFQNGNLLVSNSNGLNIDSGSFGLLGDAQSIIRTVRRATTDATANVVLTINGGAPGASNRLTIPAKTLWTFTIKLSAYNDTDNLGAWWIFRGGIRRNAANGTALISSIIVENGSEGGMSSTSASVVADDTNEALEIRVTGLVGKNIRWVGVLDISQVSY